MLLNNFWVLFSIRIWYLAYPMDRSYIKENKGRTLEQTPFDVTPIVLIDYNIYFPNF